MPHSFLPNTVIRAALLSGKEAHLWWLSAPELPAEADNALLLCLSQEEQGHYHALKISSVKREYLMTRALVRCALSQYADVAPLDWEFVTNPYGRPELAPRFADLQLNFNVSHSYGAVACLIAHHHQVGLDIENQLRNTVFADISDSVLSSHEQAALDEKKVDGIHFLHYWTLKEAYSKALGYGLSLPFKEIICVFDQDGEKLEGYSQLPKEHWQFLLTSMLGDYLLSIAIHKATPEDISIRLMECMPELGSAHEGQLLEKKPEYPVPRLYTKVA